MKEINGPERTQGWGRNPDILSVRNEVQAALWENEIMGQISDGMWENTQPYDHYEAWCDAEVVVADPDMKLGRNFFVQKDNYSLTTVIQYVGDRMIREVGRDTGIVLTEKGLRAELVDLKKIMKTHCD